MGFYACLTVTFYYLFSLVNPMFQFFHNTLRAYKTFCMAANDRALPKKRSFAS